jgi:hypothetical protein
MQWLRCFWIGTGGGIFFAYLGKFAAQARSVLYANLGVHNIPMDIGAAMQFNALRCTHITLNAPRNQYTHTRNISLY